MAEQDGREIDEGGRRWFDYSALGWDAESVGTVEEFVRRAVGEIREIYVQARARRLGVDVYWHSNL